MTVTRVLLASAALVLLVQWPRLRIDNPARASLILVVLPLVAMVLFLAGLALSSTHHRAPRSILLFSAVGGAALALFAGPGFFLSPELELAIFLLGTLSLVAVTAWAYLRQKALAPASALLIPLGGALALLVFLHAALGRYVWSYQTESIGIVGFFQRAIELTVGFGLGGILMLAGGALAMAAREKHLEE